MKKTVSLLLIPLLVCSFLFTGCKSGVLDPRDPVTLTMWHNFGGDMQKAMDELIDEFNSTVGKEQGIIINVTAITSSAELQETLDTIISGDPGAPEMPDIATAYPKTAVNFQKLGMLADMDGYFTADELSAYVPSFIGEGRFGDGGLYVFPFAKSTEILYLNKTLFDRFSAATDVSANSLSTFEGIADAAMQYYTWTDGLTPDIPDDGKQFFSADSWVNLFQSAMLQQGAELFAGERLSLEGDAFARIFDICFEPAKNGGFAIYDGYSSDLSKTGDLICSTGSSAGILFYGDTVTYADNTTEKVEYSILPFPVMEGGEKLAIQRGNGFMVAASDEAREYAASIFLKWFTSPEQNMRFVSSTGYLPVTNEAFERYLPDLIDNTEDARIGMMLSSVMEMYHKYSFFTAPTFEGFGKLSDDYERGFKAALTAAREQALAGTPVSAEQALDDFKAALR